MDGSWSGPGFASSTPKAKKQTQNKKTKMKYIKANFNEPHVEEEKYNAVIVDSGAIIKHTGFSTLHNTANRYITTQGVIDEIRDGKARSHLESLPFELEVREPSAEGLAKMVEFSKKTGDYASLSGVDMHILALLYDVEKEGCRSVEHIRTEPKRALTGRITSLNKNAERDNEESKIVTDYSSTFSEVQGSGDIEDGAAFFEGDIEVPEEETKQIEEKEEPKEARNVQALKPSWAKLVNPAASSEVSVPITNPVTEDTQISQMSMTSTFGSMRLSPVDQSAKNSDDFGGQFSDAEDDESFELPVVPDYESSDDEGDEYASIGDDFSDEECDVYILDPEEVEEKKNAKEETSSAIGDLPHTTLMSESITSIAEELEMEFPSLSAACTVPYEGSDDEGDKDTVGSTDRLKKAAEEEEKRIKASLKPVSKSGKLYNSFRGYKDIVKSGGIKTQPKKTHEEIKEEKAVSFKAAATTASTVSDEVATPKNFQSRVIGGTGYSGQSNEVDDDGEGWVTSTKEIATMKAMGTLDPFGGGSNSSEVTKLDKKLPPKTCRAACATTDFAMQNVILQMNLELLSVDGVKLRKLKSWVTRCGACFKVYTGGDNDGKRLFCDRCGSSSLQRIAASVDGKTGRLKLHLKKNYKSKTRGTQFALPKPGSQNKFMGDILLSEDQLMYGAWNQRVRMTKSKKEKQSIFGTEIAATVGCHQDLTKRADIKVGFGRKNPNATKFGRERRGKKKKSTDKACGLRRY